MVFSGLLESGSNVLRQACLQVQPLEHELSVCVEAVQSTVVGLAAINCSSHRKGTIIAKDTKCEKVVARRFAL